MVRATLSWKKTWPCASTTIPEPGWADEIEIKPRARKASRIVLRGKGFHLRREELSRRSKSFVKQMFEAMRETARSASGATSEAIVPRALPTAAMRWPFGSACKRRGYRVPVRKDPVASCSNPGVSFDTLLRGPSGRAPTPPAPRAMESERRALPGLESRGEMDAVEAGCGIVRYRTGKFEACDATLWSHNVDPMLEVCGGLHDAAAGIIAGQEESDALSAALVCGEGQEMEANAFCGMFATIGLGRGPFDFTTLFRGNQTVTIEFPGMTDHASNVLGMTLPGTSAGNELSDTATARVHDVARDGAQAIIARIWNARGCSIAQLVP